MSYILPQVLVFQQFKQLSRTVVGNLNACIIGPHYNVARYSESSEKDLTKLDKVFYEGLELITKYPFETSGVDTDYVRVFFEDVSADYSDLNGATIVNGVVRSDSVDVVFASDPKAAAFKVSMSQSIAFRRSSGLGGVCSGDRLYLYCAADRDSDSSIVDVKLFKSAVTGECEYVTVSDDELDVKHVDANYPTKTDGFIADRFWYAIRTDTTTTNSETSDDSNGGDSESSTPTTSSVRKRGRKVGVVYADGDGEGDENGGTTTTSSYSFHAEFRLRPQFVAEFLDMLADDPDRYVGKTLLEVANSVDGTVYIEQSGGLIYAKLPAITSIGDIAAKLQSNPIFNKYFELVPGSTDVAIPSGSTAEVVTFEDTGVAPALIAEFSTLADEKNLEIGDVFTHVNNNTKFTNTVYRFAPAVDGNYVAHPTDDTVSFIPSSTNGTVDATQTVAVSIDDLVTNDDPVEEGETRRKIEFSGKKDTVYTATVVKAGTVGSGEVLFRVSDSTGIDKIYLEQEVAEDEDGNYYVGLSSFYLARLVFKADAKNKYLYEGQTFSVKCFASTSEVVVGFKPMSASLAEFGEGFDTADGATIGSPMLGKRYASLEIPQKDEDGITLWEARADEIVLHAGIKVYDSDPEVNPDARLVSVTYAQPYIQYRVLSDKYAKTIHTVSNTNDVMTMLGTPDMDNPLAQGVYHAKLNSGEQAVYFISVRSDDPQGYAKALEILEKTDDVYTLVPMTTDDNVLDILQDHVNTMSGSEAKQWRIGVFGFTTDRGVPVYNEAMHPADKVYTAKIVGDLVTFSESDETNVKDDIWKGDKVRFSFRDDGSYCEATVVDVYNSHTNSIRIGKVAETDADVPLSESASINVPVKVEVWRSLESAQWIDYVANKASSFADRRMYAVFPEVLWNNGKKYPGYIGAAAIAGLISSVPPQQGLTHIELKGFDDIPMVYSSYTRTQLNKVAEYGGLIIMQDVPNGPVYVRHQVSTRSLDGNVLTTELSVTKNLDAISYYFAEVLEPYIGKYNISQVLLKQIETTVRAGINYLGSYNTGAGLLGPMLVLENNETKINGISRHETLKDHVVVSLSLELPLPCNVIELYLSV